HINLCVPVIMRSQRDLLPIWGETREPAVARAAGQTSRNTAVFADCIDLTGMTEDDLRSIRRWETQQARRVGQFLRGDGRDRSPDGRDQTQKARKSKQSVHMKEMKRVRIRCPERLCGFNRKLHRKEVSKLPLNGPDATAISS